MSRTGRWIRLGAAAVLGVLGLGLLGDVLSPAWNPPPRARYPAYESLPPVPSPAGADPVPIRNEETGVPVHDATLPATVVSPLTAGRHPAVVLVSGAGAATRVGLADEAEHLARAGIVALRYDKRTTGYSFAHRDYGLLAEDATAAVRLLRQRPDVDPARVGLWGISEGGWVVSLAAARSSEVAFAVLVSAPAVSPQRQVAWSLDTKLERLGAPVGARRTVAKAMGMSGFDYVDYDPVPALTRIRQPLLAIYGAADSAVPVAESADRLTAALEHGGNPSYTVRFFADADHGMRRPDRRLAPGYLQLMVEWVTGLPDHARPQPGDRIAGATPVQEFATAAVPRPPWYATGAALAIAFGLVLAAIFAGPVAALVGKLRRGRGAAVTPDKSRAPARPARSEVRRLAVLAIALAVGLNVYIGILFASALSDVGSPPLVNGGWLVVRIIATATVIVLVSTIARAVSDGGPVRGYMAAIGRVTWWGAVTGTGLILVIAAYWGVFALRW